MRAVVSVSLIVLGISHSPAWAKSCRWPFGNGIKSEMSRQGQSRLAKLRSHRVRPEGRYHAEKDGKQKSGYELAKIFAEDIFSFFENGISEWYFPPKYKHRSKAEFESRFAEAFEQAKGKSEFRLQVAMVHTPRGRLGIELRSNSIDTKNPRLVLRFTWIEVAENGVGVREVETAKTRLDEIIAGVKPHELMKTPPSISSNEIYLETSPKNLGYQRLFLTEVLYRIRNWQSYESHTGEAQRNAHYGVDPQTMVEALLIYTSGFYNKHGMPMRTKPGEFINVADGRMARDAERTEIHQKLKALEDGQRSGGAQRFIVAEEHGRRPPSLVNLIHPVFIASGSSGKGDLVAVQYDSHKRQLHLRCSGVGRVGRRADRLQALTEVLGLAQELMGYSSRERYGDQKEVSIRYGEKLNEIVVSFGDVKTETVHNYLATVLYEMQGRRSDRESFDRGAHGKRVLDTVEKLFDEGKVNDYASYSYVRELVEMFGGAYSVAEPAFLRAAEKAFRTGDAALAKLLERHIWSERLRDQLSQAFLVNPEVSLGLLHYPKNRGEMGVFLRRTPEFEPLISALGFLKGGRSDYFGLIVSEKDERTGKRVYPETARQRAVWAMGRNGEEAERRILKRLLEEADQNPLSKELREEIEFAIEAIDYYFGAEISEPVKGWGLGDLFK